MTHHARAVVAPFGVALKLASAGPQAIFVSVRRSIPPMVVPDPGRHARAGPDFMVQTLGLSDADIFPTLHAISSLVHMYTVFSDDLLNLIAVLPDSICITDVEQCYMTCLTSLTSILVTRRSSVVRWHSFRRESGAGAAPPPSSARGDTLVCQLTTGQIQSLRNHALLR